MSDRSVPLAARLAALEAAQRPEEPQPGALVERWTGGVRIPPGGALPASEALLARLYAGDFVPREKKPLVVDTRRSLGCLLVSVDDPPMAILDACSQIATLTHGFGADPVRKALYDGVFRRVLWTNPDSTVEPAPELSAYADLLRRLAPPGLDHVAFVAAGGAEANEKALWLARLHAPGGDRRRRVLAFQGGFHGRTLVTLGATWNPKKRGPFEMRGFEAVFAEPSPDGLARALADHAEEVYAAIVEPMMAEGGDLHHDAAFYRALRAATRRHSIPLVVDEVQTGFATGGPFFWWQRHGLGLPGAPDTSPDLLTLAKKAQLGVVLSRYPDPAPVPVHLASAVRGHLQALFSHEQHAGLADLDERLAELARAFADLVSAPRRVGSTFAFDLPSNEHVQRFIAQRFARGLLTYPAGSRTVRFRLGAGFDRRRLADLFARIRRALERLDDPAAKTLVEAGRRAPAGPIEVRPLTAEDWPFVLELERRVYEPARRTTEAELRSCAALGMAWIATVDGTRAGMAFAAPLERATAPDRPLDGPAQDPTLGTGTTLYAVDLTVDPAFAGRGVGRALKRAQVAFARRRGYAFVSSRNREEAAEPMTAINRSLGGFVDARYAEQYGGEGVTAYVRIPLAPPPAAPDPDPAGFVDLASGIQRPFRRGAPGLAERDLEGPLASKLNLSNFATVDLVHYVEHLRVLAPRGTAHVYFTSSRDETVDKCLRCLRVGRPEANLAVGLAGGYVGHTTAAARSLSDPAGFPEPFGLYPFPRLPHPAVAGAERTVEALEALVARHGAASIFGLFVEVVGERSGWVVDGAAAAALRAACDRLGIPLVAVETGSGGYRAGAGAWGVDTWPDGVAPDAVLWSPGGQLGHVFVSDDLYVATPLTLISTWDGDEVCVIRTHEHLRAAGRLDLTDRIAALDGLVEALAARTDGTTGGLGLFRTVRLSPALQELVCAVGRASGVVFGRGAPGVLVCCPAFDQTAEDLVAARRRILPALEDALAAGAAPGAGS